MAIQVKVVNTEAKDGQAIAVRLNNDAARIIEAGNEGSFPLEDGSVMICTAADAQKHDSEQEAAHAAAAAKLEADAKAHTDAVNAQEAADKAAAEAAAKAKAEQDAADLAAANQAAADQLAAGAAAAQSLAENNIGAGDTIVVPGVGEATVTGENIDGVPVIEPVAAGEPVPAEEQPAA